MNFLLAIIAIILSQSFCIYTVITASFESQVTTADNNVVIIDRLAIVFYYTLNLKSCEYGLPQYMQDSLEQVLLTHRFLFT